MADSGQGKRKREAGADDGDAPAGGGAGLAVSDGAVVLPGDVVIGDVAALESTVVAAAGLVRSGKALVASRAGVVDGAGGKRIRVLSSIRRYVAAAEDVVVGVVVERHGGEGYGVDLRGSARATLPALAFEGATKRNKPNLAVGSVVYSRVAVANRDMDPELSCISPHSRSRKDWVTGETVFGELKGGYVFECSLSLARELLDERCVVLRALGRHVPFELAIGCNGRVWVNSGSTMHTVVVTNAILNSEGMAPAAVRTMVGKLAGAL